MLGSSLYRNGGEPRGCKSTVAIVPLYPQVPQNAWHARMDAIAKRMVAS